MINARIYNYSNLKESDKKTIIGMLSVIEEIKKIGKTYSIDNASLMESVFCQAADFVVSNLSYQLRKSVIEHIVSMIDSYETEIYEKDTDDYFYGMGSLIEFDNFV